MVDQIVRINVFPRPEIWPSDRPYVATSYRIKTRGALDVEGAAVVLSDPVSEVCYLPKNLHEVGSHILDVQFAPGVTDNAGTTALKSLRSANLNAEIIDVYSGNLFALKTPDDAAACYNSLIQIARLFTVSQVFGGALSADETIVQIESIAEALDVDLSGSDDTLMALSRLGIVGRDGRARGPLGLSLEDMRAIRAHYETLGRKPTDIEIETLAQSWSEHCKHRIFNGQLDEIKEGLFKRFIARATEEILERPEKQGFCLSVFKDNAGAIRFDDNWMISDKVETHNSPSALDPYGGAMTGVVGVNRDCLGFGLGAKPIANRYGFCLAYPQDENQLFRDEALTNALPSAAAIDAGVVAGIEAGGNQSGIPTCQGFFAYDPRFRGKPLVFAGTVGLLPMLLSDGLGGERPGQEKAAQSGDHIIVVGGAVGQDGIHGATFSSVALDSDSPATAVQIGDPITQKQLSDVLLYELRDKGLYNAITDNGAGGLSSSVGEMAEDTGGGIVYLDRVPLKYPGLAPWEIWISESQERMTLAVSPHNVDEVLSLFRKRDVLAADIGEFTDSGELSLRWNTQVLGRLSMTFLHDGAPLKIMHSKKAPLPAVHVPEFTFTEAANLLISSPTLAGRVDVAELYDHEVQATSVIKPLQGVGAVRGDACVIAPVTDSSKGVGMSHALYPWLSEIAPYTAATLAVDTAVRHLVAIGVAPDKIALQDNFCWCHAEDPHRLWQLREAARGCYDSSVHFGAPYISGKDSMFNDFKGFDANGKRKFLSALPTLLISSIGIVEEIINCQTIDFKSPGDVILLVGEPSTLLGGSHLSSLMNAHWQAPVVDLTPLSVLSAVADSLCNGLIASSTSIGQGGLFYALVKSAKAGRMGFDVDLETEQLWSEAGGQFLLSVAPSNLATVRKAIPNAKTIGTTCQEQYAHFGKGLGVMLS